MGNIRKVIIILVLAVLFVSAIAVTIVYYNGMVNNKNSEIALLQSQISNQNFEIANLSSQISNLNSQIANLSSANLRASLAVVDSARLLNIDGSVTNTDKGTAYNAGLHVVAYTANGKLEINATVPLASETFFDPFGTWAAGGGSVTSLSSEQVAYIRLNIYHEGVVTNWTVTPVWKNLP